MSNKNQLLLDTKLIVFLIGTCLLNSQTQAQQVDKISAFYAQRQAITDFDKGTIAVNEDVVYNCENYIQDAFPQYKLIFKSIKKSPFSVHLLFQHYIESSAVYQSTLTLNIANSGRVLSIVNNLIPCQSNQISQPSALYNSVFFDGEKLHPAFIDSVTDDMGLAEQVHVNGGVIYKCLLTSFLNPIDTTVKVKVFNPDPLTTANASYGGNYRDMNDSNLVELNQELQFQNLKLKYDNNYFILENDRVKIRRISPVVYYDTAILNTVPIYGRGDKNFEALNCMYHITQASDYITQLNFKLGNYQIFVDPHGRSDDNSAFTNDGQNRFIKFGDGGIDDAEDADPIIHEYHHNIFDEASQSQNIGLYRKSIEEGTCDFMAASYSKSLSLNQWTKVYNWDGNNAPWLGRTVSSGKYYPNDLSNSSIYSNGEIWSTFLMRLETSLGREYLHKLLYQSFYSAAINIDFPTMAKFILQSDTLINNAANCWKICVELTKSNILICGTPIEFIAQNDVDFINTTETFSINNRGNEALQIALYSIEGKLIISKTLAAYTMETFDKCEWSQGIYLVHLKGKSTNCTKKITVY